MPDCYCGSSAAFVNCCSPVIDGKTLAETAEQLMRSRYSAFVVQHQSWLLASWHPQTRPSRISFDERQQWIGLKVKNTVKGTSSDNFGEVEFIARYKVNGKALRLHEHSRFERINGQWFYKDGDHLT